MENNCGIYKLTNTVNGKVYIGQSVDLERRRKQFFIFSSKYSGEYLDRARIKYPDEKYWTYEIIEYCSIDELNNKEQYYIQYYNSSNRDIGYNLTFGGEATRGYTHTEETKRKMSEIKKGLKFSDEIKEKMSERLKGEGNPMWGKHHTEETKQLLRNKRIGTKLTEETKRKMSISRSGENSPNFGKPMKEETKIKLRNINIGKKLPDEVKNKIRCSNGTKIYQIDMETYEIIKVWNSMREVENELKIPHHSISKCCKGIYKKAGGFIWKFVEED